MTWEVKKLNKVGNIFSGNSINEKIKKKKFLYISNGLPYIATKDVSYDSKIDYNNGVKIPPADLDKFRIAHKNSILICAEGGSAGRKLAFNTQDICFVNKLFALEPFHFMEPRYVFYFYQTTGFREQFKSKMTGLIGGVSIAKFKNIDISVPPLLIQKKTVEFLDFVFEKIAKAKENTENNLKNSKEIFNSYLQNVFEKTGEGWELNNFEDCLEKVKYTPKIKKKDFLESGDFPIISQEQEYINGYWNNSQDVFKIVKPIIIFGDHTQNFKYIDFNFVLGADGVKILQPKSNINCKFFYYFLKSITLRNLGYARHYRLLTEKLVPIPSLPEQKQIITKLNLFSQETKKLEIIYNQKLIDIEELKKSILEKAFKGELTKVIV
jgi:type I restriction enzyme, S subunit